jgi:hypothetical protein
MVDLLEMLVLNLVVKFVDLKFPMLDGQMDLELIDLMVEKLVVEVVISLLSK